MGQMTAPETSGVQGSSDHLPLSNAQRLIWTAQQMHPDAPVYNMAFTFEVDGSLEKTRFEEAFATLVEEAESLRTTVEVSGADTTQTVMSSIDYEIAQVDFRHEQDPSRAFQDWARAQSQTPLDLTKRSFDVALAQLGDGSSGWYLCQHHVLADAASFEILFTRLSQLYIDLDSGSRLPQTDDHYYATDPQPTDREKEGFEEVVLYGKTRRDGIGTLSDRLQLELDSRTVSSLDDLVARSSLRSITHDMGRFKAYLAALVAHIHRVAGQDRIQVGVPLLNRHSARSKRTPGLFTEVFPLTVEIETGETFSSLFGKVAEATHQLLAKARPGSAPSNNNRQPNVAINYLTTAFGDFAGLPARVNWVHSGHVEPDHTLRFHVSGWEGDGGHVLLFDFNRATIDVETQTRSLDHFSHIFDAMITDPSTVIAEIPLMGSKETETVSALAQGPKKPEPEPITAAMERVFRDFTASTAISDEAASWSFGEVDEASRRIAAVIQPGQRVGMALPRSTEAVLAILGILRAGAAFVPIDPSWPEERIAFVLNDARADLLICDEPHRFASADLRVMRLTDLMSADPVEDPLDGPDRSDLAYILYTSGSTGNPKGVSIEHGSLANYVMWARETYDGGERAKFPLFTPLTFDLTMTSIFVPLTAGGTIRIYPQPEGRVDTSVRDVMADDTVDIVKLTPSHLSLIQDMDLDKSRVTKLILGGEDLTKSAALRAMQQFNEEVRIFNEYGPTEATVGCVVEIFDPSKPAGGSSVPIGRPIVNMSAWILDGGLNPVPFGVAGELWLGGVGVARGYLGNSHMADRRFRTMEHLGEGQFYRTGDLARLLVDGTIEYLGRNDDQVKIRGARVELGEVEARLAAHPSIERVVAAAHRRNRSAVSTPEVNCLVCGISSAFPGVSFDNKQVCSECRAFETYREDASVYFKTLDDLREVLRRARSQSKSDYDCISLLSGGKDSTYALARLVDLGARPLAFTLDNGYISDGAKENIRRVTETLGVDHVFGTTPAMNEIFVDSLQRHANVCNGCFKTIYTLSMKLAKDNGIPLIVTGLSRGQFFETRLTQELFSGGPVTSDEIDAKVLEARKAYHQVEDGPRRLLDVEIFETDSIFGDVHFADFYRYTDVSLDEMLDYLDQRLPWVRPTDTGRSTNCLINDVGIFVHKRERGFHNYALPYSWDVRLGHKQRDAAMDELNDDIDPAYVQRVLDEIGYPSDVTAVTGGNRLVAYYTANGSVGPTELRAYAEKVLPATMVPSQFVELDDMPLTSNGKINRKALPDPDTARPELDNTFIAPFTDLQRSIAAIWSDVLGMEPIGIRDDFFDLGGDSIMAIRIVARCNAAGIPIELRQLFENPTVEELTQLELSHQAQTSAPPEPSSTPSKADMDRLAAMLANKESGT